MLSAYRFYVTLTLCGIITAFAGLAVTIIALFTDSKSAHTLARNLMAFSLLCLVLQSSYQC